MLTFKLLRFPSNQLIALTIAFSLNITFAITSGAPSVIISFVSLLTLGTWLFRNENEAKRIFFYAFLLNSFFAIILSMSFVWDHGNPFIGGGDDEMFYLISKAFKAGSRSFDNDNIHWSAINYKAYIILMGGWLKLLNGLGFSDDSFLNLSLLNSFFGALSVGLIFLIFRSIANHAASRIAMYVLLFPPTIFYSATIIRETIVLFVFSLTAFILVERSWSFIVKPAFVLVCFVVMYHTREVSAVLLAVFVSVYFALSVKGAKIKFGIVIVSFFMVAFVLLLLVTAASIQPPESQPETVDLLNFLSYQVHYYNNEIIAESAQASLGIKLRNFNNPIVVLIGIVYAFFSPVPPLFVQSFTFSNLFLGLGNIIWYFLAFCYALSAHLNFDKFLRNNLATAVLVTLLFLLVVVFFTSGDPRHLFFIQPFIIGFAVLFIEKNPKSALLLAGILFLVCLSLGVLYFIVKFAS